MPTRMVREGNKRRHIPARIKRRIWNEPCTICGSSLDVCVDHIVPVSEGGTSDECNLQPLCVVCNHRKGRRLTNVELREYIKRHPREHAAALAWQRKLRDPAADVHCF